MGIVKPIIISLLVHLTLVWLSQFAPPAKPHKPTVVEFEIQEKSKKQNTDDKLWVRQALAPEKLKTTQSDDPLRFWSEETQHVKKQQIARLKGLTQNRNLNAAPKIPDPKRSQAENKSKAANPEDEFDPYAPSVKNQNALDSAEYERGVSTFGQDVDAVELGTMTALNTDRYLYNSFYSRVETAFRSRWEPKVRMAQRMIPNSTFANTANEKWTTVLEIWLKANGEFHSYHILKSSGIIPFDQAAAQAFVESGMFPNPPKDKIDDDGLVKIKYQLTVLHNPTMMARMRE